MIDQLVTIPQYVQIYQPELLITKLTDPASEKTLVAFVGLYSIDDRAQSQGLMSEDGIVVQNVGTCGARALSPEESGDLLMSSCD